MANWYKTAIIKESEKRHDYEAHWDYEEETDLFQYSTLINAFEQAKQDVDMLIVASLDFCDGFDIYYAKNIGEMARYVDGTYSHPVIVVDLEHMTQGIKEYSVPGLEEQIARDTIMHELTHAIQESEGREYNEEEAEGSIIDFPVTTASIIKQAGYHIEYESFAQAFEEMEGIALEDQGALEQWTSYQENVRDLGPDFAEEEAHEISITIYGSGGWHRYHVLGNGKVMFSAMHAEKDAIAKAKRLGFEII